MSKVTTAREFIVLGCVYVLVNTRARILFGRSSSNTATTANCVLAAGTSRLS